MEDKIQKAAGVPVGTEVNGEIVIADYDSEGNFIGWHKEAKKE